MKQYIIVQNQSPVSRFTERLMFTVFKKAMLSPLNLRSDASFFTQIFRFCNIFQPSVPDDSCARGPHLLETICAFRAVESCNPKKGCCAVHPDSRVQNPAQPHGFLLGSKLPHPFPGRLLASLMAPGVALHLFPVWPVPLPSSPGLQRWNHQT